MKKSCSADTIPLLAERMRGGVAYMSR